MRKAGGGGGGGGGVGIEPRPVDYRYVVVFFPNGLGDKACCGQQIKSEVAIPRCADGATFRHGHSRLDTPHYRSYKAKEEGKRINAQCLCPQI